jgi:[acyl-carrier-protein] S-malonyltransferase
MPKVAFLFPGQGSQFAGMGKAWAEASPDARRIFDRADAALGFPLSKLCWEGPEEELKLTENTQPAILTTSVAAFVLAQEMGIEPDFVAGHSLGEYSALVAAGCLDFADAVTLVRNRGRYMQEAVPAGTGAMAALVKLPAGKLGGVLEQAAQGEVVTAANYNSPDQIAIAGHAGAVARACDLAKAAGAKRAIPLPVSAPFHCPLMEPAQQRLKPELDALLFRDLLRPLVNNWQARVVTTGADARVGLYEQIPNSVLWTGILGLLRDQGVTQAYEIGPGTVLAGFTRQTTPEIEMVRPEWLDAG